MYEQRKNKRMAASLELSVSSLFRQDNAEVDINSPIEVTDVSKGGIGFISNSFFPIGYYFNASLQLGSQEEKLNTVVKIVRCVADDEDPLLFHYGCEFVGMAPVLNYIFDNYEKELNNDNITDTE